MTRACGRGGDRVGGGAVEFEVPFGGFWEDQVDRGGRDRVSLRLNVIFGIVLDDR